MMTFSNTKVTIETDEKFLSELLKQQEEMLSWKARCQTAEEKLFKLRAFCTKEAEGCGCKLVYVGDLANAAGEEAIEWTGLKEDFED